MGFSIIAAIGKNRELGKNGQLIWHLPGDLKFFKKITMGYPILMGRKTFESLPGMLPGRKHYVVTRGAAADFPVRDKNLKIVNDLGDFADIHMDDAEEIFVIGGATVYAEMLKYTDEIYLTEVEAEDTSADAFFPEFDKNEYNRVELGKGEDNGIKYTFCKYTKK